LDWSTTDNSTWTGPHSFGVDSDPWVAISWNFNFPNSSGYYRFYSIATDNVSNTESQPASNDTLCGYDISLPTAIVDIPTNSGYYNSLTQLSGTCNDTFSDIASVNLTIYNVTSGKYWNGTAWESGVNWSSTTLSGGPWSAWTYNSGSVTWANNTQYLVNATATDNASNVGSADSNSFTFDSSSPVATVSVPVNGNYYNANALASVSGTCSDTVSGVAAVNITIYNVTSGKYWNGATWATGVNWSSTTLGAGYDTWSNDTSSVTWANNTQYLVNATATDNASNVGSADSNSFTFDSSSPVATVSVPVNGNYYNAWCEYYDL